MSDAPIYFTVFIHGPDKWFCLTENDCKPAMDCTGLDGFATLDEAEHECSKKNTLREVP